MSLVGVREYEGGARRGKEMRWYEPSWGELSRVGMSPVGMRWGEGVSVETGGVQCRQVELD
jgi:hypothetical protein